MGEAERRRAYRSPRRTQQAAQTRDAILGAAAELFASHGWAATGMRDVAAAAGVSVQTVYATYRSKGQLLLAAVDAAVVGDDEPVALADRAEFAALRVGPRRARAAALARLGAGVNRRTAGLYVALRHAAASDPEVDRCMRELEQRRRADLEQALGVVAGRPVTARERDGMWALASVEVYRLLTELAGWTDEQYEEWAADVLVRLLPPTTRKGTP